MYGEVGQREVRALGHRVRLARQQAGLTGCELARRMQMQRVTLRQVELGEGNPRLKTVMRIARVLGLAVGDLVCTPAPRRHVVHGGHNLTARCLRLRRLLVAHAVQEHVARRRVS